MAVVNAGVEDIQGVKKWNEEATALVPVQFKLRITK